MIARYLERGVAAGTIAGLAYGAYMGLVGNPLVAYMEAAAHHDHGHEHASAVAETTTTIVSIGSGVLWGILLGGLFGLTYYFLEPSLPGTGTARAYVLAGAGFLSVSVAPWLLLPPATPGAQQALATGPRLIAYAALMVVGALVSAAAILVYRSVAARGRLVAAVAAAAPIVILGVAASLAAPTVTANDALAGELVAAFRGVVVLSQAALWLLVAGCFGWLHRRGGRNATTARDRASASNA
ncbi:CbtA family protein [Natronococcus sp. JC468]|uniref:CbtA family protein n=1 Tax=Natronococcus sp. JC468 TaxID=1961921 RepID=UPI00143B5ACA|nr:CbtA family protein [Natronococcus sp. JC468]NKE35250.1 CbtA family protein [Natronococcus sp. JC468]